MTCPDRLYFNHVPKTAGTSVRFALEQVFGPRRHNTHWLLTDFLADGEDRMACYELICGHFGMYPTRLWNEPRSMIVFLRDPSARAYSHYRHIQTTVRHHLHAKVQDMTYEDFVLSDYAISEMLSYQARFLGLLDLDDLCWYEKNRSSESELISRLRSNALLAMAKSALADAWFVGLADDDTSLSLTLLGAQMGVPLDDAARWNVTQPSNAPQLGRYATERLQWLNEFDVELFRYGRARLKEVKSACCPPPQRTLIDRRFLSGSINFLNGFVGGGWHPAEFRETNKKGYCWSRTANPWLALSAPGRGNFNVVARVATYYNEDWDRTRILVNSEPVRFDLIPDEDRSDGGFSLLFADVPDSLRGHDDVIVVEFELPRLYKEEYCQSDGAPNREVGVYLDWIRATPPRVSW